MSFGFYANSIKITLACIYPKILRPFYLFIRHSIFFLGGGSRPKSSIFFTMSHLKADPNFAPLTLTNDPLILFKGLFPSAYCIRENGPQNVLSSLAQASIGLLAMALHSATLGGLHCRLRQHGDGPVLISGACFDLQSRQGGGKRAVWLGAPPIPY